MNAYKVIMFILYCFAAVLISAETNTVSWKAEMEKLAGKHPHDMIRPEQLEKFRNFIKKDHPSLIISFKKIEKNFNKELPPEMGRHKDMTEWVKISGIIYSLGREIEGFALAYLATGDKKYGMQAKRILLHLAKWSPDAGGGLHGNDEVPMKIMELCPRVYDWIFDLLSEEERDTVRKSIRTRGKLMWTFIGSGNSLPSGSHPGRMLGFMGEAGVVFYGEIPEANEWLEKTAKIVKGPYPRWGGNDGGWSEGPSYWEFYQKKMVQFLWSYYAATRSSVLIHKPFFRNNTYYGIYCAPATLPLDGFGDGAADIYSRENQVPHGSTKRFIGTFYGNALQNGYFIWYSEQAKAKPGAYEALMYMMSDKKIPATSPTDLAQSQCFYDIGWAAMHSNISEADNDVFLLFKSSPYGAQSHSHADQNGFSLSAFNKPLIIPSGYYKNPGSFYGSPHHDKWTRTTMANNCILVNGKGQAHRGGRAKIEDFCTDGLSNGISYACGNAKECYSKMLSLALRHCIKLDGNTYILIDDLAAGKASRFSWLVHSLNRMDIKADGQAADIRFSNPPAFCSSRIICSHPVAASQTDKFSPSPTVGKGKKRPPNQWHTRIRTETESKQCRFYSVFSVSKNKSSKSIIPSLTEKDGTASLTWKTDTSTGILILPVPGKKEGSGEQVHVKGMLGTVILNRDNRSEKLLLVNGTGLSVNDTVWIKSDKQATISVFYSRQHTVIGLGSGTKGTEAAVILPFNKTIRKAQFRAERNNLWIDFKDYIVKNQQLTFKHPGKRGELIFNF